MDNTEKITGIIQQLQEIVKDGCSDNSACVTVKSHNVTWHNESGVGLRIVLTNGREVHFSESF